MSAGDLHLESLLDRERVSGLTQAEQALLDGHLSGCVQCRFERQVRRDFARSLAGPVAVDDVDEMIARALSALPVQPVNTQVTAAPQRPARLARAARRWLTVGVLLLGSAAALAFVVYAASSDAKRTQLEP